MDRRVLSRRSVSVALRRVAAAVLAATCIGVNAQEFVVRDIRVEGIQRTEAGTVFTYLPVRVGDRFDPERGTQAIRALYASGLFKDVRLEVDGDVLVVIVDERPAIATVDLSGVKEFDALLSPPRTMSASRMARAPWKGSGRVPISTVSGSPVCRSMVAKPSSQISRCSASSSSARSSVLRAASGSWCR